MDHSHLPAALSSHASVDGDDLKRIQGIGPVIERQLKDAGVFTFAQLALLSPDEIGRLIKGLPLLSAERIARQDWPAQARALAREIVQVEAGAVGTASEAFTQAATFNVELLVNSRGLAHWSRVEHVEGGAEASWPGWHAEGLVQFITSHIAPGSHTDAPSSALSSSMHSSEPVGQAQGAVLPVEQPQVGQNGCRPIVIADVSVGAPELAQAVDSSSPITRARAALSFRLSGPGAVELAASAPGYTLQILACDTAGGHSAVLAVDYRRLAPHQLNYSSALEFALPDDGRYQLVGMVLIAEAQLVQCALGPVLRVIP